MPSLNKKYGEKMLPATLPEKKKPLRLKPVAVKEFRMRKLKFDEIVFGGDTKANITLENNMSQKSGSISPIRTRIDKLAMSETLGHSNISPPGSPVKHWDDTINAKQGISILPDI